MNSWMAPTISVRVSASCTYWALPGSANTLREENRTIEAAVVGPETRCQEEPNRAATIAGTMPA